jgi:ribosomal protein S18 acetylase RimI-like enzyme
MNINLSDIEFQRFGLVTARADDFDSIEDVDEAVDFCVENKVAMLVARVNANRLDVVQTLESLGACLCDTLMYFEIQTMKARGHEEENAEYSVRRIKSEDRLVVLNIAREAFSGYYGHYHSDSKLNKKDCDDAYVSWCESTIDSVGDVYDVLVIEDASGVCGFITTKKHSDGKMELMLSGIKKNYSGRGLFRRLMLASIRLASNDNIKRVFTSTQISNLATQKLVTTLGFSPIKGVYTFHIWFKLAQ